MPRTLPRREQEEQDYQRECRLDVLLEELKDLQLTKTRILSEIHIIRFDIDRTPNPGYAILGIGPRDTTDNHLRIGDTVKVKTYGKFRATTGKIVKVTLPNGQTTNRAHHNLRKI